MATATTPTQQQVDEVVAKLAPDVVRIRFNEALDWSDDPAIYFRVVLSDDASRRDPLAGVAARVRAKLTEELGLDPQVRIPYVSFRSKSEQDSTNDPKWD